MLNTIYLDANIDPFNHKIGIRRAEGHSSNGSKDLYLLECRGRMYLASRALAEVISVWQEMGRPVELAACAAEVGSRLGKTVSAPQIKQIVGNRVVPMLEAEPPKTAMRTGFVFRVRILGEELVNRLAGGLTFLFRKEALGLVAAGILAVLVWMATLTPATVVPQTPAHATIAIVLFVLSGLVHELGHATALRRRGERPGPIGFGLYLVLPAFYSDVTAAWKLDRSGRILVDCGGAYLQAAFMCVVALVAHRFGQTYLYTTCWLIMATIVINFSPLLKLDGHWLLIDLVGARDPAIHFGQAFARWRAGGGLDRLDLAGFGVFVVGVAAYLTWLAHAMTLGFAAAWPEEGMARADGAALLQLGWLAALTAIVVFWTSKKLLTMGRVMASGAEHAAVAATTAADPAMLRRAIVARSLRSSRTELHAALERA